VEDRVHAEWEEGQNELAGVEPDKSHSCERDVYKLGCSVHVRKLPHCLIAGSIKYSPRYCTFSSEMSLVTI
jgi:hypothetical protein